MGDTGESSTPTHCYYVVGKGWTYAKDIAIGDQLKYYNDNTVEVTSIQEEQLQDTINVFNLEVEDGHTYFVSENDIWVHNMGCGVNELEAAGTAYTEVTGVAEAELTGVNTLLQSDLLAGEADVAFLEDTEGGVLADSFTTTGIDTSAPTNVSLSGRWNNANESMSEFSRDYQTQITGKDGEVWLQNGVKFDGMNNGALIDAKGKYAQFVDESTGEFYNWFMNRGGNALINEANRQIAASEGATIKWYFAEESAMNATQKLLSDVGITNIQLIYQPKI